MRSWTDGSQSDILHPCTPNQNRYLLASLGGAQSYYLPLTFSLPAEISISRLRRAVLHVIADIPALGAAFVHAGGGRFSWRNVGTKALKLRQFRARDEADAVADAVAFVHDGSGPPSEAPCKLHIARLPKGGHLVTLALHHAVADAVSLGLVVDRISDAYSARPSPGPVRQGWNAGASEDDEAQDASDRAYWRSALESASAAGPLPLLRPARDDGAGARGEIAKRLDPPALHRLAAAARGAGVTTFEATFAAYLFVLGRQTGRSAACATFQSSGRRAHPERENVIGVFSNALPVLANLDPDATFADHARLVRRAVRGSLRHEALPYHEIIRETGIHPRFGINWYPGVETLDLEGLRIAGDRRVGWQSDFDLNFHALQTEGGLAFNLSYPLDRLQPWRASVVLDHVTAVLESDLLTDARPLREIALPGAIPAPARPLPAEPEPEISLSGRVARIAEARPAAPAIVTESGTTRYSALMADVDALAKALVEHGAGPGRALAIEVPRSAAMVTALLAADRVGAVFAIYDPAYPASRRKAMDETFGPALRLKLVAPDAPIEDVASRAEPQVSDIVELASGPKVRICRETEGAPAPALPAGARYALFTSGTTGRPKCVIADGRGLARFIDRMSTERAITADDRFALLGGLGHDPMLRDVLLPLTSGAALHVPTEETRGDPRLLFDWLSKLGPTLLNLTPQLARVIAFGANGRTLPTLRHATFGGDTLSADAIAAFRSIAPNSAISNLYGATETPQAASLYDLPRAAADPDRRGEAHPDAWDVCPVGHRAGSRRLILDRDGQPAATGEPAEIVVEGDDLALGYYDAADGQGQSAVPTTGLPLRHRTGDIGLRMPSGDVLVLGRVDDQVKIRGFRVEPSEISRHLEARADVTQATTIARPGANGETELIAYAVAKEGATDGAGEPPTGGMLLESCRRNLPSAMVPRAVVVLDRFPLTANGKIDRAALPDPDADPVRDADDRNPGDAAGSEPAETPEAFALARVVAEVLGRASVPPSSCVRDLGVDSLSYLSVSLALESRLGALPRNWDILPLTTLANMGSESSDASHDRLRNAGGNRHLRMVEAPVLMRAVSIAGVVAGHFGLIGFGGATSALFFIAGHSFGRFQVPAVLREDGIRPILNLVALIAIPTVLYLVLLESVFDYPNKSATIITLKLLLLGNLYGPNEVVGSNFWFVNVLVQALLLLAAGLALPPVRRAMRQRPFECACLAVCGSVLIRYASGAVWDTSELYNRVVQQKLWLFSLGWCLAQAATWPQKAVATALALSALGLEIVMYGALQPLTAAAFAVILAVPRVPVPAIAATTITRVAAASLFIYITHLQFRTVTDRLPGPLNADLAAFAIAIAGGVAIHLLWDRLTRFARRLTTGRKRSFYTRGHP